MAVHAGSWFGLPDFGITELLTSNRTAQGGSQLFGTPYAAPATTPYTAPTQKVLGSQTSNTGSSGGSYNTPSTATNSNQSLQQGLGAIQQGQNNGNDQIEADYNQSMGMLDNAQSGLQGQAGTANSTIDTGAASAKNEITNNQTVAEQGANASLSTAEKQGTSAMQQARDLFRQTQQTNNAQLSALGISSSSVSEALAERLGVETARRIAGVTGSLQEVRQNTTNELGRIKTYYQGQISALTQHVADQKSQIQNSLVQGLNQINAARGQAASDKAAARSNLLSQVQNQIYSLTQQQQQFTQALDQWAAQKSAALTPLTTNEGLQQTFQNFANLTKSDQFNPSQYSASMNVGANGTPTYQFGTINPKKTTNTYEDFLKQAATQP